MLELVLCSEELGEDFRIEEKDLTLTQEEKDKMEEVKREQLEELERISSFTKDQAKEAVMKSGNYAYIGRRLKKRDFRRLWITRISAAAKMNGMNYSTFMNGLKKSGIEMNRKMLSEIAIADPAAFTELVNKAKNAR